MSSVGTAPAGTVTFVFTVSDYRGMPTDPEISREQLKPYLGRWSPCGPHGW